MRKKSDFGETVSLQQYRDAINFLKIHIQLLDASLVQASKIIKANPDQEAHIHTILSLSPHVYDCLNHPAKQQEALIKHSQKKNVEFAILRLFNLFTAYLQHITKEMFDKRPMLVVGKAVINKNGDAKENLTLSYAEIIKMENYDNLKDHIVQSVFRSIEELKSTKKLLDKILKDTKVNISDVIVDDALTYLEMRHLFIHNHGKVDAKYAKEYGSKFTPVLKNNKQLPAKFGTFSEALQKISILIFEIDKELIKNGMVTKREVSIAKVADN